MEYTPEFREFLAIAQKCKQAYVGYGNPNASILIVANEPGAVDKFLIKNDLQRNLEMWKKNLSGKSMESVEDIFNRDNTLDWDKFNPLWPYKGQHFTIGNEFRHTSRSWLQYQKLIDMIISPKNECERSKYDQLDFFRHAFVTDFSAVYGRSSKDIPKETRLQSIMERLPLFNSAFITHFPIIIVASGHYVRDFKPLTDLRNVFQGFVDVELIKDDKGWRNIHYSEDKKRILIHTHHFASAIKDEYIKEIARVCKGGRL